MMRSLSIAVLAVASFTACATTQKAEGEVDYAAEAEANLKLGNEALAGRNYEEAAKYFEHVRATYPLLEAAREAELRMGDVELELEQFPEARDRYQTFIKLHPTHPKVDYAAFKIAQTWFREIPSDFFLFPPPFEKDQAAVTAAARAMADFIRQYPSSQYQAEAKELLGKARRQLANHELYVAGFYEKRKQWAAVAGRLETLMKKYPDVGLEEEALFGLHRAYTELKQPEKANDALKTLISLKPGSPAAARAEKLLGS